MVCRPTGRAKRVHGLACHSTIIKVAKVIERRDRSIRTEEVALVIEKAVKVAKMTVRRPAKRKSDSD